MELGAGAGADSNSHTSTPLDLTLSYHLLLLLPPLLPSLLARCPPTRRTHCARRTLCAAASITAVPPPRTAATASARAVCRMPMAHMPFLTVFALLLAGHYEAASSSPCTSRISSGAAQSGLLVGSGVVGG